jgi:hypothetical protein
MLEDRIVPDGTPGPATHLLVTVPEITFSGRQFEVDVKALDAANQTATGYLGTVHFTPITGASVPADYTFTAHDHGFHEFLFTLNPATTPASQAITATDTVTATITGTAITTVRAAPVTTHFLVSTEENNTAGVPTHITVTALDAANHVVPEYAGTVRFTNTDTTATALPNYTFVPGTDNGRHTFAVTFNAAGPQTVTATDTVTATITGSATPTISAAGTHNRDTDAAPAAHLQVTVPETVFAGRSFTVVVQALDASNDQARSYTGTVHFTPIAGTTVPADYTFTAHDHGYHAFTFTLNTLGSQAITATDTVTATITGTGTTTVLAAPVATHLLVITPEHATIGVPTNVTVVALDAANHRVPNYTGTVGFTSTLGTATLLPGTTGTFAASDMGRKTFQVIFNTAGLQTVTARDTVTSSINGTATFTVDAVGPVTHFGVVIVRPAVVGQATQVIVQPLDANNRVVAAYTGTIHFTNTDGAASALANYMFVAGDFGTHSFAVTFNTPGLQSITVNDTLTTTLVGSGSVRVRNNTPPDHDHDHDHDCD